MTVDSRIRAGDVAVDLVERGKVFVVEKAAHSVAAHQKREGYDIQTYKSHPLLDISDDEAVWTCVYLPDKPTTEFSGGYDFPESRLARIPVEEARDSFRRPQERLVVSLLENLFAASTGYVEAEESVVVGTLARQAGIDDDLVDEARELADVDETIAAEGDD